MLQNYENDESASDFILLKLEKIVYDVAPRSLGILGSNPDQRTEPLTICGYGRGAIVLKSGSGYNSLGVDAVSAYKEDSTFRRYTGDSEVETEVRDMGSRKNLLHTVRSAKVTTLFGDSGGPLIDKDGRVVGILNGGIEKDVEVSNRMETSLENYRKKFSETREKFPDSPLQLIFNVHMAPAFIGIMSDCSNETGTMDSIYAGVTGELVSGIEKIMRNHYERDAFIQEILDGVISGAIKVKETQEG